MRFFLDNDANAAPNRPAARERRMEWSVLSLFRLFEDDCVIDVLDIGAAAGSTVSYQRLIDAGRARVTGFEPDAVACRQLQTTADATHRYFPMFIGDGAEATFYETNDSQTGSIFAPNTALLDKFQDLGSVTCPLAQHHIKTTRLDDIHDLGNVDFIKIDVQGAELMIFENAGKALDQTLIIQTEVGFVESYKGQPMFSDIDAFLRSRGFQYHRILGTGSRAFKPLVNPERIQGEFNQHIWADVLYVKDWMHLEKFSEAQLRKYAGLLHDLFGSCDLAYLALRELDRRMGSAMAGAYLRRFRLTVRSDENDVRAQSSDQLPVTAETDAESRFGVVTDEELLRLETSDGLVYSVPPSLDSITTFILLEQERWFEKEPVFLARYLVAGMTAIDIGANHGLYSFPVARAVGPDGTVFAFEPGSNSRQHLEVGAALNRIGNLRILPQALSDGERDGWLSREASSEFNAIVAMPGRSAEHVEIASLDAQTEKFGWSTVDFVKIDAEGQEARIVAGGREFFSRFSPLVLYEVKHGESANESLRWMFAALGYDAYRLSGDSSMLLPVAADEPLDGYQPNLFAAKLDRAADLAGRGLLAMPADEFKLDENERNSVLAAMVSQPYAIDFAITSADIEACPFGEGLLAYGAWLHLRTIGPSRRYAALLKAYVNLQQHRAEHAGPALLSTLARVAHAIGHTQQAVSLLKHLVALGEVELDQPFFPAAPHYDAIAPGDAAATWFLAAAIEQCEFISEFSSTFSQDLARLRWLAKQPWASAEVLRRTILVAIQMGMPRADIRPLISRLLASETRNRHVWALQEDSLFELLWA